MCASFRDRAPGDSNELKQRNLSTQCPYCHSDIVVIPATEPVNTFSGYSYFVGMCPHRDDSGLHCKPFFCVYQALNNCITERYPFPTHDWATHHKSIPENIRKDFAESFKCISISAYKSTVTMCRRVIESIGYQQLGDKIKDLQQGDVKLYKLIDILKEEGLITENLRSTAHEIRHLGNYGAHFQNDGLDDVSREEAKELQQFVSHLLNDIYYPFQDG